MGVDSASGQHRLEQGTELLQFFPIQNPIPILDFGHMIALKHPAIFQLGYDEVGGVVLAHGPSVAEGGLARSYGVPWGWLPSGWLPWGRHGGWRYDSYPLFFY